MCEGRICLDCLLLDETFKTVSDREVFGEGSPLELSHCCTCMISVAVTIAPARSSVLFCIII